MVVLETPIVTPGAGFRTLAGIGMFGCLWAHFAVTSLQDEYRQSSKISVAGGVIPLQHCF